MTTTLAGKVALVTGASAGIGEATALALAAEGATIAVAARRGDRLAELVTRIENRQGGGQALAIDLDVTDEQACRDAVARTVEQLGGLDILVNNAGVMLLGPIEDADTEDWRRMIDTNVLGLMYLSHAALPHLLERGGTIVQVSSVAGRLVRLGSGVYNASKWAVNAFSESLRQEVQARGVNVVLVEPGMVATELREHITNDAAREHAQQRAESVRQLQPEDIAAAVVYAVTQPDHVAVNEILVRPKDQSQ